MPRIVSDQDEYTLTAKEVENKEHNKKIYGDYIKQLAVKRPKWSRAMTRHPQDYEVTDKSHLLMENLPPGEGITYQYIQHLNCIPLPPETLMDVIIKPKYVYLGKVKLSD